MNAIDLKHASITLDCAWFIDDIIEDAESGDVSASLLAEAVESGSHNHPAITSAVNSFLRAVNMTLRQSRLPALEIFSEIYGINSTLLIVQGFRSVREMEEAFYTLTSLRSGVPESPYLFVLEYEVAFSKERSEFSEGFDSFKDLVNL